MVDKEEDEESIESVFYNDEYIFDIEKVRWHTMYLNGPKVTGQATKEPEAIGMYNKIASINQYHMLTIVVLCFYWMSLLLVPETGRIRLDGAFYNVCLFFHC